VGSRAEHTVEQGAALLRFSQIGCLPDRESSRGRPPCSPLRPYRKPMGHLGAVLAAAAYFPSAHPQTFSGAVACSNVSTSTHAPQQTGASGVTSSARITAWRGSEPNAELGLSSCVGQTRSSVGVCRSGKAGRNAAQTGRLGPPHGRVSSSFSVGAGGHKQQLSHSRHSQIASSAICRPEPCRPIARPR